MAVDFNATTSKVQNDTAALGITTLITICAWVFADGTGEGGFGRVIALDENNTRLRLFHENVANTLTMSSTFTNISKFNFPITDGVWCPVAVSYDAGSTSNVPVARASFASATVTTVTAPTGTYAAPASGYCIGNNAAQDRTWDGMLQHPQVFDRILTAQEMDDSLRRPGSVISGLQLWFPLRTATDVADLSGNGFDGTATALTDRDPNAPIGLRAKMEHYA